MLYQIICKLIRRHNIDLCLIRHVSRSINLNILTLALEMYMQMLIYILHTNVMKIRRDTVYLPFYEQ